MKAQDMQVIGLCRFSYPAKGGFQIMHDTIEERRAFLYAPERMEERFHSFETIALPGLKAQTDPNFTFLIVIGECLPEPYLERLKALIEDMPQAKLVALPPEPHRPAMQRVINRNRKHKTAKPCLQFRHDDDDAIAINYVEKLREAADDCAPLIAKHRYFGIDFNRGYSAIPGPEGLSVRPSVLQYYGVALAMAVAPGVGKTIMNFAHHKMNQFMNTATFTDQEMFVRCHGQFNDSEKKSRPRDEGFTLLDAEGEALFNELFAIDTDKVRAAYQEG